MPSFRTRCLVLLSVPLLTTGCRTFEDFVDRGTAGYADPASESSDPWVRQAGTEGRGNRRRESTRDPLDKILWSDKAHEINRNLGVDE